MYVVTGKESGETQEFETLEEAYQFIKDVMRFDKECGLEGEAWIITKDNN